MGKAKASPRARLESWMANPGCEKNVASAVFGVPMVELSGADPTPQIVSPFASELGNQFEASLESKITQLLAGSDQIGLNNDASWPEKARVAKNKDVQFQLLESLEMLREIVDALENGLTNFVIRGFRIPFTPFDSTLEIDMLAISPFRSDSLVLNLVIGEVKVYPDLGGFIDERKVSGARRQAGLYYQILTDWVTSDEITKLFPDVEFRVQDKGFLVLTSPQSALEVSDPNDWKQFAPSLVTNEDLTTQSEIISTNFAELRRVIEDETSKTHIGDEKFDAVAYINGLDHKFTEGCWGRCPLAQSCYDKAVDSGDLVVLGTRLSHALGDITVEDAIRLANDSHSPSAESGTSGTRDGSTLTSEFADFRFTELGRF